MKKILFTATVDSHIKQFHIPYLKLFKEKGWEVHVATNGTEKIPYCDQKYNVSFERNPYKINNIKAIKQLKKIIDEEKYDIIHTHTPMGSVVTRLAAKKARNNGTRVIYTAHGFHFYKGAPLINWMIFYPVEKYLAKYTDTLIVINKEDYNLAVNKFSKRCHNIEYIPGIGIDEEKLNINMKREEMKSLRASIGLKEDDFVLIFPARLDKNKNQIFLINAMEKLIKVHPNIHLLLPGLDEINGLYQKKVKKKGLNNNIHFLGYRRDIPQLLSISNVSVSTSIREGLGLNLAEGNYLGLPVVATKNRGHKDIVKEEVNGFLINPNDEDAFCQKVLFLYENKDVYNKMKRSSFKQAKKFLLKDVKKRLIKIYEKEK